MSSELPYSIASGWPIVSLRDVTTKIGSGATPRGGADAYLPIRDNFAFVRSQNIFDRRFDTASLAFISDAQALSLRNVELQPGDILLNITGDGVTFGRAALVDEEALPACVNQHVSIIRADPVKAVPGYLLAYLTHPDVKPYISSFNSGGSRRAITKGHIESFRLPLPPLEEQHEIAQTLSALDCKIESNRRTVVAAQNLGDGLFASASNETRSIEDVATITMGSSPKGESLNDYGIGTPFFQGARDFGFRFPSIRIWTESPVRFASQNDTLISVRAPVGELNRAGVDCSIGRGVAGIHSRKLPSTLYYALRASSSIWDKFQGEGTVFASVNKKDVHGSRILWVSDTVAGDLEGKLSALDSRVKALELESQRLAALRDSLLPEFLSGRMGIAPEGGAA